MSTVKASTVIVEAADQEFEAIFHEHHDMAYRTAYGVTGSAADAEDIVQTIFLRLLDRGLLPDLKRNPGGYIYRAAVNESLNLVRARKRLVLVSDSERIAAEPAIEPELATEEVHKHLYEAVAKLSKSSANILILRYVHKYSDAEIAKLLGTSRGTVAVGLYRARARLRKWMRASLGGRI
jgi:RNA polymerase sigma-70 factor, ECF subfamily